MAQSYSSHPWIARYCARTLQLLPTLPTPVAIRWAVSGFPYCSDTEPEQAAEMFVGVRLANERAERSGILGRFFGGRSTPIETPRRARANTQARAVVQGPR